VSRYEAYPYMGEAKPSFFDRLVSLIPQVNSQPSSVPPTSDMSTRVDYQNIPELNQPQPTQITPQDIGQGALTIGELVNPVDTVGFREGQQQYLKGSGQITQGGANVGEGVLNMLGGSAMVGASLLGGYSGKATRPIKPIAEQALSKLGRETVEGGEFLMSKRKGGKNVLENVTGNSYNKSFISVADSEFPHMAVDESTIIPEMTYEQLKKEKGTLSKINLFRKGAGWKWAKGNEFSGKLAKVAGDDAVISVHRGDKHYFALSTELNSPTAMQTFPKGGNPTLKPSTKGVPQFGKVVGHIEVRGKKHPLYDRITFGEKSGKPDAILNYDIRNEKDLPTAIRKARREKHLIPDMSVRGQGKYIGAPNWVRSKTDVDQMRDEFDAMVAGGFGGADWYERVKGFTKSISAGDKNKENMMTEMFALWSAQANPDTNFGWALQAHNQYARGLRGSNFPMVKTGQQTETYLGRMEGTVQNKPMQHGDMPLGPKTQVYHDQMNFNVPKPLTGTNDIWHGRAFGYRNPDGSQFSRGFTPQEHVFLDNETALAVDRANKRKLGGRSNWTPGELQASAWVYAKGKAEHEKYPGKFKDLNEAINWAKLTYPDYLQKFSAFGTSEAIPGKNTGHLPALLDADFKTKLQYTQDVPGSYGTPQDVISEQGGMLGVGTRPAMGIFESKAGGLETNPAQAHQILVDLADGEGGKVINTGTENMLNAVEATRGYIDMQNASAWHKFFPVGAMSQSGASNALRIETGAPLDEDRMRDIAQWAFDRGFYISDNGKSLVIFPGYDKYPKMSLKGRNKPTKKFPEGKPFEEVVYEDQDKLAQEALDSGQIQSLDDFDKQNPTGEQMSKMFEGLKETKTRQRTPGYLDELKEMFPEANIERGRVVSGYVEYEGANPVNKISNSAPENAGRSLRTKILFDYLDQVPGVLEALDKSKEFKQLITDNIMRANDWSKKMNSPLRQDHMNALEIIKTKGLSGLRKAMKEGAVLPAVALPILGSAYQLAQEQGIEG